MNRAIAVVFLFLVGIQLGSALITPGHGNWYDLNRPRYYDPDTGLPYEWASSNGRWILIPRPVGTTYNPLYLEGANGYYRRSPGADPRSRLQLGQTEAKGRSMRSMLANPPKSSKYYVVNRGGS
ncbi:MAG: hypothetical protein AABX70_04370 [Nanoarchaeota archaeon]